MPRSIPHRAKDTGELIPPSSTLDRIDYWLMEMRRTWPQKELETEEIANWHRDLGRFPVEAIDWAFDSHRRNGRFFPIYGQILDLCITWEPKQKGGYYAPGCSKECKAKHWTGYNQRDIMHLYDAYVAKRQELNGPLKKPEILALFDELDKWRGKPPEWRMRNENLK